MPSYHIEDSGNSRFFDSTENVISGVGENANITDVQLTDLLVFVVQVGRYAGGACNKTTDSEELILEFSKDGGGWVTVGSATEVNYVTGTSLVDNDPTPDRITGGTMTDGFSAACSNGWQAGLEDENNSATMSVSSNYYSDVAFGLGFSNATPGSEYDFRVVNVTNGSTALTQLTTLPSVTIYVLGDIDIGSGDTLYDGVTVEENITSKLPDDLEVNVYDEVTTDSTNGTVEVQDKAPFEIDVYDEVLLEEYLDVIPDLAIDIYDEVTLEEWNDLAFELVPNVFDSISIEENVDLAFELVPSVFDGITVGEYTEFAQELVPNVFDSISLDENIDLAFELVPSVYDEVTVTEDKTVTIESVGATYRYWRILSYNSSAYAGATCIAEIELRSSIGGADLTGSGTADASNESGGAADNAFDDDTGTYWVSNETYGAWISYDFGEGNEYNIIEVSVTARIDGYWTASPGCFALQYSDDNTNWTTKYLFTDLAWTSGEEKELSVDDAQVMGSTGSYRYFRINSQNTTDYSNCAAAEVELRESQGGSDVTGSGTPSADSEYSGTYSADKAFDDDSGTFWVSGTAITHWLKYDFGSGNDKTIVEVSYRNRTDGYNSQSPRVILFQVSADDSTWITVFTALTEAAWSIDETRVFPEPTDLSVNVYDSVSVQENTAFAQELVPSVFDTITVDEDKTVQVESAEELSINVFDSVAVEEFVDLAQELVPNVFDGVTIEEDVTTSVLDKLPYEVNVFDSVTVEENVALSFISYISVFDTVTIEENYNAQPFEETLTVSVYDTVTVVEVYGFEDLVFWAAPGARGVQASGDTRNTRNPYETAGVLDQNFVRLCFKAPYDDITITKVTIGIRSGSTDDFVSAPTIVTFNSGDQDVTITAEGTKWSDWVEFDFDAPSDILVHVYVDHVHNISVWTSDPVNRYYSYNTGDESETLSVSYSTTNYRAYVEQIEARIVTALDINVYDDIGVADVVTDITATTDAYTLSVYDEITADESVTAELPDALEIDVYDSVTVEESVDTGVYHNVSVYDQVTVDESIGITWISYIDLYDSISVDELATPELPDALEADIYDEITVDEYSNALVATPGVRYVIVGEDVTVDENIAAVASGLNPSIYDSITVDENIAADNIIPGIDLFDSMIVTDIPSAELFQGVYTVSVYDDITVDESNYFGFTSYILVYDSVTVDENVQGYILVLCSVYDSIAIDENVNLTLSTATQFDFLVYDSITVNEYVSAVASGLSINVYDSIAVDENVSAAGIYIYITGSVAIIDDIVLVTGDISVDETLPETDVLLITPDISVELT